jgi:hypothetical protein
MTSKHHVYRLVVAGNDDLVAFPHVCGAVGVNVSSILPRDSRQIVLQAMRTVAEADLMDIGDVSRPGGFIPWSSPIEEMMDRIERDWQALDHFPYAGEICWLRNTERGDRLATELLAKYSD